jgi:hypothetical protein
VGLAVEGEAGLARGAGIRNGFRGLEKVLLEVAQSADSIEARHSGAGGAAGRRHGEAGAREWRAVAPAGREAAVGLCIVTEKVLGLLKKSAEFGAAVVVDLEAEGSQFGDRRGLRPESTGGPQVIQKRGIQEGVGQ